MRATPCVLGCLLFACSTSPASNDASLPDVADAGDASDAGDSGPRPTPPLAPVREPEAFPVPGWMVAPVNAGAEDEVRLALEAGAFTLPSEGMRDGTFWSFEVPGEGGELPEGPARGLSYAASEVTVPSGRYLFARADTTLTVYTNGALQPGDVYASGRIRVPLAVRSGQNLVVARTLGGRGRPRVQVYATEDELVFNTEDVTAPDLVVGDASSQWVGVPLLNLTAAPALDVTARVEAGEGFEATAVRYPSLPAGSVTQVAFQLVPRAAWAQAGQTVTVGLRVESPSLRWSYRREVRLSTVAQGVAYRRSFRSGMDGSAQYYGVVPPRSFDPARAYALVLSLHGASVEALGQARAYSAKDWAYVVAPTNRRPYGFDWEEWGRLDGLEVLDHASGFFRTAPDQVHLTGHSMGGHGTWQLGVLFPGRFATVGPSAGWSSFYSYTGRARPSGAFARSQASSDTNVYLGNLARREVYILHGGADTNVPVREGRAMFEAVRPITPDVTYHEEPGAGHWWDGDRAEGADCVDWPPLFERMRARRLDPTELTFTFTTPSPSVSARHSFVTVRSAADALRDVSVTSRPMGEGAVALTTANVRSLTLDGAALAARGITRAVVDGREVAVTGATVPVGPQDGKRPGQYGPFNEVLRAPFCFVYPDGEPSVFREYASYLVSAWSVVGNGHACALPLSSVTDALRRERNLVYVGLPRSALGASLALPFSWDDAGVSLGATRYEGASLWFVFPEGDRLSAVVAAPRGSEYLLSRLQPFTSGLALPDYLVLDREGARASGFFTPEWRYTP